MFTALFWKDAGERAGKTFAQALLAVFVAGASIASISWSTALVTAGTAALASLLTSVVSLPINGGGGGASLLSAVRPGRHEANHPPTPEA